MKRWISLVLATSLVFLTTACGATKQSETVETALIPVRLNEVVHSAFYAPQYVATELGFFAEEGLDITVEIGNGADTSMTALISGAADIALLGTEAGIYVYNEGMEDYPRAFLQLTQRAGNFLVGREENENFDWSDLKGSEIIGGRAGGMPQMVLEYVLSENGLAVGVDLEMITNIEFTSTAGAFTGDVGDYTAEFDPTATTLENSGIGHIVASLGEASGFLPYTVYMATNEMISEKPEVLESFTAAIYKGQLWVDSHSANEIAEVIAPQFPENDLDTLTTVIARYKEQGTWKTDPIFEEDGFILIQDIMEAGGELSKRVPFTDMVTNEFAEKVMAK